MCHKTQPNQTPLFSFLKVHLKSKGVIPVNFTKVNLAEIDPKPKWPLNQQRVMIIRKSNKMSFLEATCI